MNLLLLVAINSFVPQLKEDIKIALRHARAPIDGFSLKAVSPCVAETNARASYARYVRKHLRRQVLIKATGIENLELGICDAD